MSIADNISNDAAQCNMFSEKLKSSSAHVSYLFKNYCVKSSYKHNFLMYYNKTSLDLKMIWMEDGNKEDVEVTFLHPVLSLYIWR